MGLCGIFGAEQIPVGVETTPRKRSSSRRQRARHVAGAAYLGGLPSPSAAICMVLQADHSRRCRRWAACPAVYIPGIRVVRSSTAAADLTL